MAWVRNTSTEQRLAFRARVLLRLAEGASVSACARAGASFTDTAQVREAIDAFIRAHNQQAAPFEWTKSRVCQKVPKKLLSSQKYR
jgi:hypothetical protein